MKISKPAYVATESFKNRQDRILVEYSPERKIAQKQLREMLQREYKEQTWYDQDNTANSPLEADWDE